MQYNIGKDIQEIATNVSLVSEMLGLIQWSPNSYEM